MNSKDRMEKIDQLVCELVKSLSKELSHCLESITLVGSYVTGRISSEFPGVNILIFVKPNVSPIDILKIGEIFYKVSSRYLNYFRVKIDPFPFRFGSPIGKKEFLLTLTPHTIFIAEKDNYPPFGIPTNVLEGMRAMRKVVFGSDPLERINLNYTQKDVAKWALFDVGATYKNQLLDAPLSFDADQHLDLLVGESIEIGKNALMWGTELFLSRKDWIERKQLELKREKEKVIDFYGRIDKELGEVAELILYARGHFLELKQDRKKAFKLYEAAYIAVNKVFQKAVEISNSKF